MTNSERAKVKGLIVVARSRKFDPFVRLVSVELELRAMLKYDAAQRKRNNDR